MEEVQTATACFFVPVALAYLVACGGWLLYDASSRLSASEPPLEDSARPAVDFLLAVAAVAGILLWGAVYRQGWLLPTDGSGGRLLWVVDNLIIYSPIAAVLVLRRQNAATLFLSTHRLIEKLALGVGLGLVAVAVYLASRGELVQFGDCLAAAVRPEKLASFPAIFLEGVALAFGFVRFRWLVGTAAALVVPCAIFALAHVPGQLETGRSLAHIAAFLAFNTALPVAILWTVARSRDIVWIGLVHYLMDIAIRAV